MTDPIIITDKTIEYELGGQKFKGSPKGMTLGEEVDDSLLTPHHQIWSYKDWVLLEYPPCRMGITIQNERHGDGGEIRFSIPLPWMQYLVETKHGGLWLFARNEPLSSIHDELYYPALSAVKRRGEACCHRSNNKKMAPYDFAIWYVTEFWATPFHGGIYLLGHGPTKQNQNLPKEVYAGRGLSSLNGYRGDDPNAGFAWVNEERFFKFLAKHSVNTVLTWDWAPAEGVTVASITKYKKARARANVYKDLVKVVTTPNK